MHFDGSIYAYDQMRKSGADVRFVAPQNGRIDIAEMKKQLRMGDIRLLSVSAISFATGFCHDLAALSALAHEHGALVYADIIQAAGAVPFNVEAVGVDFCAASGFKWLMGEMGLGFLYVSPRVRSRVLRPIYGYRQLSKDMDPWPPEGPREWSTSSNVAGLFETASLPVSVAVSLEASLGLLLDIGIDNIAEHRAPLLSRLSQELPALGFPQITPADSLAPFRVFDVSRRPAVDKTLFSRNILASFIGTKLRLSISIFNSHDDIDILVRALA